MKWQDPEPVEPNYGWSQHSWGNAIDMSEMQTKVLERFKKGSHYDHFHVSLKPKRKAGK